MDFFVCVADVQSVICQHEETYSAGVMGWAFIILTKPSQVNDTS